MSTHNKKKIRDETNYVLKEYVFKQKLYLKFMNKTLKNEDVWKFDINWYNIMKKSNQKQLVTIILQENVSYCWKVKLNKNFKFTQNTWGQ